MKEKHLKWIDKDDNFLFSDLIFDGGFTSRLSAYGIDVSRTN